MNQVTTMIRTVIPRFLCLCMLTMTGLAAEHRRPNFIIVSCDNLGYGDIEPFGSTLHRTPHLNRMASEGRRLTHFCVTAGVCTPSRASLMTGCYAQRVGLHTNPRDGWVLRPALAVWAESLRSDHCRSAAARGVRHGDCRQVASG